MTTPQTTLDTDGDGLIDALEIALGTDPKKADSDGDGHDDRTELLNNYSPILKNVKLGLNAAFSKKNSGKIFLQVENKGQAWYINPKDLKRYYLGRPADAFAVMRKLGIGARHNIITAYKSYPTALLGKILIDVDDKGKAYYINPADRKAYYLGRPSDAFDVMRKLGYGITNGNLGLISVGLFN
jgi:hypothetical protein